MRNEILRVKMHHVLNYHRGMEVRGRPALDVATSQSACVARGVVLAKYLRSALLLTCRQSLTMPKPDAGTNFLCPPGPHQLSCSFPASHSDRKPSLQKRLTRLLVCPPASC